MILFFMTLKIKQTTSFSSDDKINFYVTIRIVKFVQALELLQQNTPRQRRLDHVIIGHTF